MKKWIAIIAGVPIVVVVGFVVADRLLGSHRIENWIGSVVVGIANSYLVPEISYEEIAYESMRVDLGGVAFTAPDGTRIIDIGGFSLTLAEIPRPGRPLLIERVEIRDGTLNLIHDPETGGIKGLIPMLKPGLSNDYEVKVNGKTSEFKMSESLQLEQIVLENIDLRYDDGSGKPLILDDISITSEIAPEEIDGQTGWYSLDIDLRREGLELSVPGDLNLDTMVARVDHGSFKATLNEETVKSLPSALQTLLAEHAATGSLDIQFNGMVPMREPNNGLLTVDVALENFNVNHGEYVFPRRLARRAGRHGRRKGERQQADCQCDRRHDRCERNSAALGRQGDGKLDGRRARSPLPHERPGGGQQELARRPPVVGRHVRSRRQGPARVHRRIGNTEGASGQTHAHAGPGAAGRPDERRGSRRHEAESQGRRRSSTSRRRASRSPSRRSSPDSWRLAERG